MTINDANVQFATLQTAVDKAGVDTAKYIFDLKAQVAAGGPVTEAQLDALGVRVASITSTVTQFDINNTEPVIPVPVIPPAAYRNPNENARLEELYRIPVSLRTYAQNNEVADLKAKEALYRIPSSQRTPAQNDELAALEAGPVAEEDAKAQANSQKEAPAEP